MNIVPVACISPTMCCVCTGKPPPMKICNDRQRLAKTGEDPGKCNQNKHQTWKAKRTNVIKNCNLNTAFKIPVVQCQATGSTGRVDDHVYSLPDFSGYYTEHEFWKGIYAF